MTIDKLRETIALYRQFFETHQVPKAEYPLDKPVLLQQHQLGHCHDMLDAMERFIAEGRIEKAFRWLGFVQGCLWCAGLFTVAELADHNRNEEPVR